MCMTGILQLGTKLHMYINLALTTESYIFLILYDLHQVVDAPLH